MRQDMIVNTILKVVRPVINAAFTTLQGDHIRIAEIEAADETGSARVRLVNSKNYLAQCNIIKENGTLIIRNALVSTTGSQILLEINHLSSIEPSSISFSKQLNLAPQLSFNPN